MMKQEQMTARNPLRVLDKILAGRPAAGGLGLVLAPAGVGKTAFLVQIGLDSILRGKKVLHIALGQNTDHLQAWYDALFDDLAGSDHDGEVEEMRTAAARNRILQTFTDKSLSPQRLEQTVDLFGKHLDFHPDLLLVDGYDWQAASTILTAAAIGAFRACAHRLQAPLWMTAQPKTSLAVRSVAGCLGPCREWEELIDVAVYLEPAGSDVSVRIIKDNGLDSIPDPHLLIHGDTLGLASSSEEKALTLPPGAYTLLSGGAQGAESLFGQCAEQWGIHEINYSFEGHEPARSQNLVRLTESELTQGEVSDVYLKAQMHRKYPATPLFRKVLQSIWHQVNTAGEVFVVGTIQEDATVRGGTGWAAELARHWHKPVHVYDQEKKAWFDWRDGGWTAVPEPVITRTRFAGTGTRFLTEEGRAAIRSLFQNTFAGR